MESEDCFWHVMLRDMVLQGCGVLSFKDGWGVLTFSGLRVTEWLKSEGTAGAHLVQPPVQAGPPRASSPISTK